MKRQRSRNRGGGGGGSGSGGGGNKPTHNVNRAFDSNGPEGVKIRGHAQHVFEKYQQLARDAQSSGDRVLAENHLQHAEHYFRLIRAVSPNRPASDIIGRDAFTSGIDIDFEDETGGQAAAAAAAEAEASEQGSDGETGGDQRSDRGDYQNRDQNRDQNQNRSDSRDRYEGGRRDYRDNRSEGARSDGPRSDRPDYRDNRSDNRSEQRPESRSDNRSEPRPETRSDSRPDTRSEQRPAARPDYRNDAPRSERYSRDDRRDRYEPRTERNGADPLAVVEPQATPLVQPEPKAVSSRSRSRAPSQPDQPEEGASHVLRSHDGGVSHAPAFLQQRTEAPAAETADEAPAAPKRRGRPPRAAVAKEPAEEA